MSKGTKTRDAARYRELSAISDDFRQWLNMNSHVRRKLRYQARSRDRRCFYCGKPACIDYDLAHIVSLHTGGTNQPDNLTIAHHKCNVQAADRKRG